MILVYRYRVKSLSGLLNKQSRAVNFVFNFCNDTQKHALKWRKKWPSWFDLCKLTNGSCVELGLHSGTVNSVCDKYVKSRKSSKRAYLRYRGKKSLGWVPLKGRDIKREGDAFRFAGNTFRVFNSRPLPDGKIKDGTNFSRDRKGNWFLNIVIELEESQARPIKNGVGIDLGLKDFATLSNGVSVPNPRHFRSLQEKLAKAQRAKKRRLALSIHSKIRNSRLDFHHKLSSQICKSFDYIAVGNVSAKKLAKTKMAKSVQDVGWSSFRSMLAYKAVKHGAMYEEVNEAFSSVTCSACGSRSGPSGLKGLQIREWCCPDCGVVHDRDINAANNILATGHRRLVVGASAGLPDEEMPNHQ